ncbi:efflux RND transporter periplasmic adaptor subunit [bacterium]|nr:efflux RND transporter periplasmic adaptor subunit [bacterium]
MTQPARRPVRWWMLTLVVLATGGTAGWYALAHGTPATAEPSPKAKSERADRVTVEVVAPKAGGIDRVCVQPGTLEPFEAADLYAKVSGFLAEQTVDIGSRVKAGQVLARIAVPEHDKQLEKDAAEVKRAEAKLAQMTAGIATAEAELKSAGASVALAAAEVKSKTSYKAYREKQRQRIRDLATRDAIDAKLADEQEDQYQAAVAAELAAGEAVNAARQKEAAARAKVEQAKADRDYAKAEVDVAIAQREKSAVIHAYAVIRSPYTGVVTRRSFHPGDFIRSADGGGGVPVLSVERTEVMRVVVQVPDRDVPFVSVGDPAVVEIDALGGAVYRTTPERRIEVARAAEAEDPHTRMMRTEIDLPNPDGRLRRGMFGRVRLALQPGALSAVRIPSAALVGKAEGGKAVVRVVRDDVAQVVPVVFGVDNGAEVEILSGLSPADSVIVRASGPVDNGTRVSVPTAASH